MLAVFLTDAQQSINVGSLPTITLHAGWRDNLALFFTGALAVVGFIGIIVAVCTLLYIKRQATLMERQTTILKDSVVAAKASAKAANDQIEMMKSKERAKLRFELDAFDPESSKAVIGHHIKGTISVFGSTEALIEKTVFFAGIHSEGEGEIAILPAPMAEVPNVIRSGSNPLKTWTILFRTNPMNLWVPTVDEGIDDVLSGKSLMFCKGYIRYADVFNGKWEFRFNRRYKVYLLPDGQCAGGYWEDCGEPEDNGEYHVETPP